MAGDRGRITELLGGLDDIRPAAAEIVGPATAAAMGLGREWTLLVRLRGGRAEVTDSVERGAAIASGLAVREVASAAWDGLARLEVAARPLVRGSGLPAELPATLERCVRRISASDNELDNWHVAAHARNGIVRLWPGPALADSQDDLGSRLRQLREETATAGGTVVLECAAPELQAVCPVRIDSDATTQRLESGLKRVFDPGGILSPGRWP